jgi:hypothetical protein
MTRTYLSPEPWTLLSVLALDLDIFHNERAFSGPAEVGGEFCRLYPGRGASGV